ncbi:peroxide stress protein YaaA [Lentisalinibacter sediminis]|uniref:peroxide stress protein YaaA n=1 Tax=Lentisalinibacter sediminis TaxID=2992237 RepID=UPI00386AF546
MIIVLSPAKTLDFDSPLATDKHTKPRFQSEARKLVEILRGKSEKEIASLMNLSPKLTKLNVERYRDFSDRATAKNARPALLAFKGDVYQGLQAERFDARDLNYAQDHLRILSGLYGVLRPLDLMQPYRLEMGTSLANDAGKDLYAFWGDRITRALNEELDGQKPKALVNLASNEYFGAVNEEQLDGRIVTPVFKDRTKSGDYRVLSFFAKRARGMMAAWIVRERVDTLKGLKDFPEEGYRYSEAQSEPDRPVFLRAKD